MLEASCPHFFFQLFTNEERWWFTVGEFQRNKNKLKPFRKVIKI